MFLLTDTGILLENVHIMFIISDFKDSESETRIMFIISDFKDSESETSTHVLGLFLPLSCSCPEQCPLAVYWLCRHT